MEHTVKIRNRRMLASGLTAASPAAVVGGVAAAQSTPTPPADTEAADSRTGQAGEGAEGHEGEEAAQLAQMDGLISEQDAIAAATADGGTADTAELRNENSTVVWEVAVTNNDGTVEEVKFDARNGEVLAREADENEADDNEADEGPEAQEGTNG